MLSLQPQGQRYTRADDPVTVQDVPLFNPRVDIWLEHFVWSVNGLKIIALTATGRATLYALDLNRARQTHP